MEKISKEEAKEKGLKHYFTGKVCRNGGLAPRRVSNNQCTCENCKAIKAKKDKEYVSTSRGKEVRLKASRKYWEANREAHNERVKDWQERNKEFVSWYSKLWREENAEWYKDFYRKYYKENKHEYARRCKEYRQRLKEVTPSWYNSSKAKEFYDLADKLRDATGEDWDVDHIIPVKAEKVCGLHWHGNLQVIPATLNRSKGNKLKYTGYLEWLEEYDRPLYSPVSLS